MRLSIDDVLIIGCAVAFVVVAFIVLFINDQRIQTRKRAEKLKERRDKTPLKAEEILSLRRKSENPTPPLLELLMKPLPNMQKLAFKLERGGVKISAKQYMLRCLLALVMLTLIGAVLGFPILVGFFVGIVLTVWLPLKVIDFRIERQKKMFLRLFPDAIDLIVRGLRSGLPVSDSIVLVSTEVGEPVAGTFTLVAHTMKLGVPMEQALQEAAKRLNYTEFNFFVTSTILQRETGGNLSEILNNLGDVLRKRFIMQMKVRAMTSEARASGIIVGSLPFFVCGAVSVMNPDYIALLFTDPRGHKAIAIASTMLFMGIATMRRLARFEI